MNKVIIFSALNILAMQASASERLFLSCGGSASLSKQNGGTHGGSDQLSSGAIELKIYKDSSNVITLHVKQRFYDGMPSTLKFSVDSLPTKTIELWGGYYPTNSNPEGTKLFSTKETARGIDFENLQPQFPVFRDPPVDHPYFANGFISADSEPHKPLLNSGKMYVDGVRIKRRSGTDYGNLYIDLRNCRKN